jgi:hypothetical protein
MQPTSVQLHDVRIEVDDVGVRVERDGVVYTVAWRAAPPAADPPAPPAMRLGAMPSTDPPAPACTCLAGWPYPLPCPVHPRVPGR